MKDWFSLSGKSNENPEKREPSSIPLLTPLATPAKRRQTRNDRARGAKSSTSRLRKGVKKAVGERGELTYQPLYVFMLAALSGFGRGEKRSKKKSGMPFRPSLHHSLR